MHFVFRADASREIGTGHIMRCLSLAIELRDNGGSCKFICRAHDGNLITRVTKEGFEVATLPLHSYHPRSPNHDSGNHIHSSWLGTDWETDANETILALGNKPVDWLIVDHYALDTQWESALRKLAKRIMVIDDLADRDHDCDLLLDQNLVADMEVRYDTQVPLQCARLLGPEFALLRPEYSKLRRRTAPRSGPIRRVLVSFGGLDQHGLTALAVKSFLSTNRQDIILDVVVDAANSDLSLIQSLAEQYSNLVVHYAPPSLASLISQADIAIGASGSTSWERCCLGLPALVITVAENQKPIARELEKRQIIKWLGHFDSVIGESLTSALYSVIEEKNIEQWSRRCMAITKGDGAKIIAATLAIDRETKIAARIASEDDADLLLKWANDPTVRKNSLNPRNILPEEHRRWLKARLLDPQRCCLFIVETQRGLPIGQVRFQQDNGDWEIHYSLFSGARGHGLGKKAIQTALAEFSMSQPGVTIFGKVTRANISSQKTFESLGFARNTEKDKSEYLVYQTTA